MTDKKVTEMNKAGGTEGVQRCVMPRVLTAENGAKGLLLGEFHETIELTCPDCDGAEYHDLETDQCGTCKDTGEVTQKVPVSWTTIKEIYAMAVKHLGA
jgi:DnaJ-class molecular chaperone